MTSPSKTSFMQKTAPLSEALPWLEDAPKSSAPAWVEALRETGAEVFAQTGLPTPKWEGWQYTSLRPLQDRRYRPAAAANTDLPAPLIENTPRMVVVNGHFMSELSTLPDGVAVRPFLDAAADESLLETVSGPGDFAAEPFRALNAAHTDGGFVLDVPKGADIAEPIEILFHTTGDGTAAYPRVLYRLGENAGLTVVERYTGQGAYLMNGVTDIVLKPSARFRHYRMMQEDMAAHHISHTRVLQEKSSQFEGFSLATGARLARQDYQMRLLDSVINAGISGLYMLKDQQNHDFTIQADHFAPDGKSAQFFKGVADAKSRAVFQGKIQVRRPAQGTDGHQSHHALLLSPEAEASAKPELEIYADDVKCAHGATTGQLDANALFYMQSRGIPRAEAHEMLIGSFIDEVFEQVTFAPMRDILRAEADKWLKERNG
ncbi:MAG: Fe-S cluster assembly protein SufD [Alphaproteobacteria bacterium]|nr:Fe-S cluster assembly protein SufD [Alphaproteobacteria bacterium]